MIWRVLLVAAVLWSGQASETRDARGRLAEQNREPTTEQLQALRTDRIAGVWATDPPSGGLIGPLLSKDDRLAIIEHLKVRNDDLDGPREPHVPSSATCTPPPPRSDAGSRYVR